MKREECGSPGHRPIGGACGGGERHAWTGAVSDDPIGMAAALIEIRKPFVVALTLGPTANQTDRPREGSEDIAVFSTDGALLAGRVDNPQAEDLLARAASDCFARRAAGVIELRQDEPMCGASDAGGSVLRVYIEPVLWK